MLAVTCDEYESSTPYHAFGRLLRDLLGVRPGTPPDLVPARLESRVRDNAPDLIAWLPLAVITIWFIYRVARGWMALRDGRPMYQ